LTGNYFIAVHLVGVNVVEKQKAKSVCVSVAGVCECGGENHGEEMKKEAGRSANREADKDLDEIEIANIQI